MSPREKSPVRPFELDDLSEERLLEKRISSLPIAIDGTWLEDCIRTLHQELASQGLAFAPECYLADEWLTPQDETVIGIPYYLAHPRLIALEKKMMLEAEGEGKEWCMKLLRHEAGHAICYAYNLHKRRDWVRSFGDYEKEYPDTYRFRPYSKSFVRHLEYYYAQYHPEEDFVETFAVWLTPGLDWRKIYEGWGALKKLEYVDRLMHEIRGKAPMVTSRRKFWRLATLRITLGQFYKRKRASLAEELPDFHDVNLRRMFAPAVDPQTGVAVEIGTVQAAAHILEKYRAAFLESVSAWSGEHKYTIDELIRKMVRRCQELKLVTVEPEPLVVLRLTAYLTTLIMNYQYTGWFRGKKSGHPAIGRSA